MPITTAGARSWWCGAPACSDSGILEACGSPSNKPSWAARAIAGTATSRNLFFLIGRGDKLDTGIPTIFRNWSTQHWRQPEISEELELQEQTLVRLRTESLLPEAAVAAVSDRFGQRFQGLDEIARIALVTVEVEGYLTHGRLSQLCERHPHDLSRLLANLVELGFLESDKRGRGTSYRFPGTGEFHLDDSNRDGAFSPFFSSLHMGPRSKLMAPSSTHMGVSSSHEGAAPHIKRGAPHTRMRSLIHAPCQRGRPLGDGRTHQVHQQGQP